MKQPKGYLRELRVRVFSGAHSNRKHLAMLVVAVGMGCESTTTPVPVYEHTVSAEMVTGAAAAALKPDGQFSITLPSTGAGQLSIDEARTRTLQFARYVTNNVNLRGVVEAGRGGYWTDPHLLVLCEDAYYVHSPFDEISHDSLGEPGLSYLRRLGAQWLIPLCGEENEPQMTVSVAIDGNDIRFANGEPVEPYTGLNSAWHARGVQLNWPDAFPISAERAARFAFETFGVRVSEVPQAVSQVDPLLDGTYPFQLGSLRFCTRWRVVLESDVTIRGMTSFETSTSNVVFVGGGPCGYDPWIHRPLNEQPQSLTLAYVDNDVSPPKTWTITIPFVSPVRFEIGVRAP